MSSIFLFFNNFANQSPFLDKVIVFIANPFSYLVILLATLFLLAHHEVMFAKNPFQALKKKWKEIVLVFFSGALAWCLAQVLKLLIASPRPFTKFSEVESLFTSDSYAFPSGHATFFMAIAFAIFFSHKKMGYVFMLFAFLIGLARVISGIHFPIDILGGFALGAIIATLIRFANRPKSE